MTARVLTRVVLFLAVLLVVAVLGARAHYPFPYRELIEGTASEFALDPALVAAVIRSESGFRPHVTSPQGARGLMQVMPETGKWVAQRLELDPFDIEDLYDPVINVTVGAFYLRDLLTLFREDLVLALAAYNGGRQNVRDWLAAEGKDSLAIADIPFAETRVYVARVLGAYGWYQVLYVWEPVRGDSAP